MSPLRARVEDVITRFAQLDSMTQIERDAVQLIRDLQLQLEASEEQVRRLAIKAGAAYRQLNEIRSMLPPIIWRHCALPLSPILQRWTLVETAGQEHGA